ncbi:MAG: hypothetical protein SNJ84_02635, partial [Verrucomicrobiia bacterium]
LKSLGIVEKTVPREGAGGMEGGRKGKGVQAVPPAEAALRVVPEPLPTGLGRWGGEDGLSVNAESGELMCPHCWLRFDVGDVKHVSVHDDLRGDPVLGAEVQQRFHAVRFDGKGRALDAMGVPCQELACPHCHHKLHPGFLELPQVIYSIVGAPSAGKSYYLSVMLAAVQERLAGRFGAFLKDADPTGNATLNAMKAQLLGAGTPEEAVLLKTQLDGEMYQRVMRHGQEVGMPRPFVFLLGQPQEGATHGVTFYDNAGEHFEPGMDLNDAPGAQHVAHSAAIFFLFDPTSSEPFRRRLAGHPDPQLTMVGRVDQQDVLLAELDVRVRALTGLGAQERLDRPLLFLVGKSDVWRGLLMEEYPAGFARTERVDGALDADAVVANSSVLREFLVKVCPTVVSIAEGLSAEVIYFPVSAFGHSPLMLEDGRLAPDPTRLKPEGVADPVLWALSRLAGWEFLSVSEE